MNTQNHRPGALRRAFTLIELLVVIAIIAMLISILLPSLGNARRTAWTVMCQSNLRQLGIAIQTYLDQQKDPEFLDLRLYANPNLPAPQKYDPGNVITEFYHVGVVTTLQSYLGESGNKPFECPAAKGLSSVRDPQNIVYLQTAGRPRVYTEPFPGFMGNPPPTPTKWTEYWFNDSTPPVVYPNGGSFLPPWGVSGQKLRLIRNPQWVVWSMDALDEFPRHEGKGNTGRLNTGKSNLLFGDHAVRLLGYEDYQNTPDPARAPAPFYNWGHLYYR